jgi:hypothetical protein
MVVSLSPLVNWEQTEASGKRQATIGVINRISLLLDVLAIRKYLRACLVELQLRIFGAGHP